MTVIDTTELAQSLKAAAEKATPGRIGDRIDGSGSIKYQCFGNDGSLVLQTDHKNMEYGFIGPNAEADELFFRECTPENILALVEALEKAQQLATQQGNIACALFDEVTAQRQRIAELEESHAQVIQSRDHYKRMSEEGLKQLAESRTVTVKLTDINEYLAEVHDKTLNRAFRLLAEGVRAGDVAAMRAAGIEVLNRRAAMLQAEPVTTANKLGNSSVQGESRCSTKGTPALDSSSKNAKSRGGNSPVNDAAGKPLTITLPDISSKAFWSGTGKHEVFHPETYKRWAKQAIERDCTIANIDVKVK